MLQAVRVVARALAGIPRTFSAGLLALAVVVAALALALAVPDVARLDAVSKLAHRLTGSTAQVQAEARYLTISDQAARYVLVSDKVAAQLSAGNVDAPPFLTKTD